MMTSWFDFQKLPLSADDAAKFGGALPQQVQGFRLTVSSSKCWQAYAEFAVSGCPLDEVSLYFEMVLHWQGYHSKGVGTFVSSPKP